MSVFTEVRGKTSDIFLLHQMHKELKYQAKFSQPKGMKSISSALQMLLHPKRQLPTQLSIVMRCLSPGVPSLDPGLFQQKTLGSFILPAEPCTVHPLY